MSMPCSNLVFHHHIFTYICTHLYTEIYNRMGTSTAKSKACVKSKLSRKAKLTPNKLLWRRRSLCYHCHWLCRLRHIEHRLPCPVHTSRAPTRMWLLLWFYIYTYLTHTYIHKCYIATISCLSFPQVRFLCRAVVGRVSGPASASAS